MPRNAPAFTPETQFFWEGAARSQLLLQRCDDCKKAYFPPRPFCPHCASRKVSVFQASGKATLYSYVINHRPRPDLGTEPHSIAVVELEEGPRMMTNIVGCPQTPEALVLDMPLEVTWVEAVANGRTPASQLPQFKPAKG